MKTALVKALKKFRNKYPNVTIAELQTFTLGWQAGNKDKESYAKEVSGDTYCIVKKKPYLSFEAVCREINN